VLLKVKIVEQMLALLAQILVSPQYKYRLYWFPPV
jgi:hypothetical protein